jgi:hypothetical protein
VHSECICNCVAGAETHRRHAPCMAAVRGVVNTRLREAIHNYDCIRYTAP